MHQCIQNIQGTCLYIVGQGMAMTKLWSARISRGKNIQNIKKLDKNQQG